MPRFAPTVVEAHKLLPEVITSAVFDGAPLDEKLLSSSMKALLDYAKKLAASGRNREELHRLLSSDAPDADQQIEASLRAHFNNQNQGNARVLCVTTEFDNDAMWGNYGEAHSGCVLGFRHIADLSTPLLEAHPVIYSEQRPVIGSGLDFLLYGDTQKLRTRTLKAVCYTKKLMWSYEREWRALTWRPNEHGKAYGDYLFYPDELESVTLGARASKSIETNVRKMLSSKYPSAALYQMDVKNGELRRCETPINLA